MYDKAHSKVRITNSYSKPIYNQKVILWKRSFKSSKLIVHGRYCMSMRRCHCVAESLDELKLRLKNWKDGLKPAGNYIFKVNNRDTETRCEICPKLTIKTPERRQWRRFGVFIVNFEHISQLVSLFLSLT